jgi:DNA modification methylase
VHPYHHDAYSVPEVSHEIPDELGWHGSIKPIEVVMDLLSRIAGESRIVYDPFLGSGTTLIACENLGRKCRAIEISPAYVAVALQRWADLTGKTPELVTQVETG